MTSKIFKSVFLLALAVLLIATGIVFAFTYNSYHTLALDDVERECEQLRIGYNELGSEYLHSLDLDGVRITHVSSDGTVLYDSSLSADAAGNHLDREEIAEALAGGAGSAVRTSQTFGKETLYYAMLLEDGTVVRVAREHYSAFAMFMNVLQPAMFLLVAVLVLAFVTAALLSRSIVKPINELDLTHPEEAEVYDELKPIINRLSKQNYKIARQMRELTARRNEFNSITANMSEGLAIINSNASILSYNKSAEEILGITGAQGSILTVRNSAAFRGAILTALSGSNGSEIIRTDRGVFSLLATPVMHGVKVGGAVVFIVDITEKEERESLRREFTANVSHELKTPLTSISGFAELIRSGLAEGEDAKRFAGNIHKEAGRLISLVGDIIKLNQVDGGEIPYDEEPISLDELAEDTMDRLGHIAEDKAVRLSASLEPVQVQGNRQMLEELIYNLVDNAIKYNVTDGCVEINVKKSDTGAVLTVSDTGIGIPKEAQSRVFERFFRVDKSRSKEIGGTGLGLSIVKHMAAYHRATVELESEIGVGTTVTVRFPKDENLHSTEKEADYKG